MRASMTHSGEGSGASAGARSALLRGLAASAALVAGYLPIAFSFGLTAIQAGLSPEAAVLTSAVVFAGASQFVLVALIAAGGGILGTVPAIWLINARHLFYGPAVFDAMGHARRRLPLPVLAYGLTDEVMATAVARIQAVPEPVREIWYLGLWLGAYAAWVAGTALGALLGADVPADWTWLRAGFDFILPALFLSLLLDLDPRRFRWPMAGGALTAAAALAVLPVNVAIAAGMLAGALLGAVGRTP